jgi:hypothetical protein
VLQVVVVPHYRAPLEQLRDYHSAFFTHHGRVVNQSYVDSFVKDMVALEAMLECCIHFLSICDLLCSEGITFILIAVIGNHTIQISFLLMFAGVALIIRMP